jgi:hypothetical protein
LQTLRQYIRKQNLSYPAFHAEHPIFDLQEAEQEFRTNLLVILIISTLLSSSIGYLILLALF